MTLAPLLAGVVAAAPVAPEQVTDELVRSAVAAIRDELYRRHDADRHWEPAAWNPDRDGQAAQEGGYTPLVVLAMLHAGESYQDPRLRDAVEALRQVELEGTYAVSLRTHVWAMLPRRFHEHLVEDTRWLTTGFQVEPRGWSYRQKPGSRWFDNSLAHYGALALWEAAKRDVPVDRRYWQLLERRFLDEQRPDGGWAYRAGQPVSGSMTAAGLTTLFITQDFLHAEEAVDLGRPRGSAPHLAALERGLEWMDRNFTAERNPGKDTYFYYYLYGVERVGLASGYTRFGGRDWFRAGTAAIVDRLCDVEADTGRVSVRPRLTGDRASPAQTRQLAFALLFLSRGRIPVAFNKLRVDGLPWNNRPRDVANLTRWITAQTETALSWQIVDLDDDPASWLSAPVLYLASHQPLPWVPPRPGRAEGGGAAVPRELEKVRRYLDLGGLLLAVNEGRGNAFARSVERAGALMYPDARWRTLPADHWAHDLHFESRGRRAPLRALGNGVRELIVLAAGGDLSAVLQVSDHDRTVPWATAGRVYLHASEMNRPPPRLGSAAPPPASAGARGPVRVTRASHAGAWNPEPAALPALADWMRTQGGPRLELSQAPLERIGTLAPAPQLVVVSGLEPHGMTDAERSSVRAYARGGGVLLFETPGGRGGFTRDAERQCAELLGAPALPLTDHAIVTAEGIEGAAPIERVEYRAFARETFGVTDTAPRLRALRVDGAVRVLFSSEDLSHALLDRPAWGVAGYTTGAARRVMTNIVRFAATQPSGRPGEGREQPR